MAKLRSYSCAKCAGVLNFDEEQELFDCPFCGNKFNLIELHRDDLIGQAESALRRLRFDTAKQKYEAMLVKNPRDFEALLGLVLADGNIVSTEVFKDINKLKDCQLGFAKVALRKAKAASEENTAYFDKLTELIDLAKEYKQLCKENSESTENARKSFQKIADNDYKVDLAREESKETLLELTRQWFAPGAFIIALFLCYRLSEMDSFDWVLPMFLIIAFIIASIFAIHYFYFERKKTRYANMVGSKINRSHDEAESLSDEAKKIRREYFEKYKELKDLDPTVDGYTPPAASKVDAGTDPFVDVTKTVNCAKCGGQLYLDKEKKLYECKFCGVAYGTSLFFNDPFSKAKKALEAVDYTEADQRFSHMLMVDPHNPDALLGRVLCAGRWQNTSDIDMEDKMLPFMEEHLKDRADEAVQHSGEDKKAFFENLKATVTCYINWAHSEQEIKSAKNAIKYAKENAALNFSDKEDKEFNAKLAGLKKRADDCAAQRKKLRAEFDELKRSLVKEETAFSQKRSNKQTV